MKLRKITIRIVKKVSILLAGLSFLLISQTAYMQNNTLNNASNSLPIPGKACDIDQAAENWQNFMSSAINIESFLEAWNDVFTRYSDNTCHYQDIDIIFRQIERIQKQMETAVMTCNNSTFEKLKEKFYNTELELIYVRNFVQFEGGDIFVMEKEFVAEKVYSYLQNELPHEYILEKFTEFEAKYSKKVPKYASCEDPNLAQLTKKFEKLVKNIESMGTQIEKKAATKWNKAINTATLNTGALFQKVLNKRLSELAPKPSILSTITGVQDGSTLGTNNETIETTTTAAPENLFELTENLIKQEDTYIKTRTAKELMAEYEALYKNSGDSISKEFEDAINKLNTTIEDTYPHIDTLKQCTNSVTDKQCQ